MNDRYFACPRCKTYTSAGYRWAYWSLEHPGLVKPNHAVDTALVVAADNYWHPPIEPNSNWLLEQVFPLVRAFLSEHGAHGITYVESGEFFAIEDFETWVEIEYKQEP